MPSEKFRIKMYISIHAAVECQVLGHHHQRNAFISWSFSAPCELSNAFHSFLRPVALSQDSVRSHFLQQLRLVRAPGSNNPFFCPAAGWAVGWCFPDGADVVQRHFRCIAELFRIPPWQAVVPGVLALALSAGTAASHSSCHRALSLPHGTGQAVQRVLMQLGDRSVDFTHIEKDSDFDLNPSVIY